ncbi:hypothetical protein HZA75_03800 [Candidatus Roizmanbacteria bacterium]|nr:hypothetical protein [Candidatus Roizmanbacteria bacterium]
MLNYLNKIFQTINKKYFLFISLLFLILFYVILYKIYIPRVNAFGCFDDCNNFMGGYFLLHGKKLFSEIFFNHNPLMAYLSLLVQFITHPQNLYELILRHRQILLIFSFVFNLILIARFRLPVLGFIIFYELTKFYLFGDRFLAEGFIVYPLVYLTGLVVLKITSKQVTIFDYVFSGLLVWFIIFMREPYVPAALGLYGFLLWNKKTLRWSAIFFSLFIFLSLITIFYHDVNEFIFNVVTVNTGLASSEVTNPAFTLLKAFFYPINLFFVGEWGHFRVILVALASIFIASSLILLLKKQWKLVFASWLILGLLNLRFVIPGKAFYGAFHLLCWYGVYIFISFVFLTAIYKYHKKIAYILVVFYLAILTFHVLSPASFLRSKPDPHWDLITNYGIPMQIGLVINSLSVPSDTLFIDGFDDIIYWQAQRVSSYKYSWYTSLMPNLKKYTDERIVMFKKSPPDFYYGSCPQELNQDKLLPIFIKDSYDRLTSDNKPSCLWIKKTKLSSIGPAQWKKAESYNYFHSK